MTRKEFAKVLRRRFRRRHDYIHLLPENPEVELDRIERHLGFAFPTILRFIYTHAGIEFFDPNWSADEYMDWRAQPDSWPERLMPLVEEGRGSWLCVDCSQDDAPVYRWRVDLSDDCDAEEPTLEVDSSTFVEWLRKRFPPLTGDDG